MILNVVKCDGCNKVIDESPDGGPMGGFTELSLKRHGKTFPNDLYHLCGYCVFRAKVVYVRALEADSE